MIEKVFQNFYRTGGSRMKQPPPAWARRTCLTTFLDNMFRLFEKEPKQEKTEKQVVSQQPGK